MSDLDQGGFAFQKVRIYLGPSIGATEVQVMPQIKVSVAGTVSLSLGTGVVLVDVAGLVTINLPDVRLWTNPLPFLPGEAFAQELWIKDLGGNAATFPI